MEALQNQTYIFTVQSLQFLYLPCISNTKLLRYPQFVMHCFIIFIKAFLMSDKALWKDPTFMQSTRLNALKNIPADKIYLPEINAWSSL